MATYIPMPESVYPSLPIRHGFSFAKETESNGTATPVIPLNQFLPIMIAGSKGATIDFCRLRFDDAENSPTTFKLYYIASGSAMSTSGTAVSSSFNTDDIVAYTPLALTISPTANRVPANAVIYLGFAAAPTTLYSLCGELGVRQGLE